MRWAGTYLCDKKLLEKEAGGKKGYWALLGGAV